MVWGFYFLFMDLFDLWAEKFFGFRGLFFFLRSGHFYWPVVAGHLLESSGIEKR